MKRFKKLTAGFLGVVMALGVCGFTALAEENKVPIDSNEDLVDAIKDQKDGQTWVLENMTYNLESTIKLTTDVTIEGNGAVLSYISEIDSASDAKERCGIHIDSGANVEINDLTIDGKGNISKHGINVYSYKDDDRITSVTVDNVKIVNCRGYAIVNNASEVTVDGLETSGNGWGGIVHPGRGCAQGHFEDGCRHAHRMERAG